MGSKALDLLDMVDTIDHLLKPADTGANNGRLPNLALECKNSALLTRSIFDVLHWHAMPNTSLSGIVEQMYNANHQYEENPAIFIDIQNSD